MKKLLGLFFEEDSDKQDGGQSGYFLVVRNLGIDSVGEWHF